MPGRKAKPPESASEELILIMRRLEAVNAKELEIRGLLERQQAKLAQTVEAIDRYFSDIKRAARKMENAASDLERAQCFRDIGVAAEFARQGLPKVH